MRSSEKGVLRRDVRGVEEQQHALHLEVGGVCARRWDRTLRGFARTAVFKRLLRKRPNRGLPCPAKASQARDLAQSAPLP